MKFEGKWIDDFENENQVHQEIFDWTIAESNDWIMNLKQCK